MTPGHSDGVSRVFSLRSCFRSGFYLGSWRAIFAPSLCVAERQQSPFERSRIEWKSRRNANSKICGMARVVKSQHGIVQRFTNSHDTMSVLALTRMNCVMPDRNKSPEAVLEPRCGRPDRSQERTQSSRWCSNFVCFCSKTRL